VAGWPWTGSRLLFILLFSKGSLSCNLSLQLGHKIRYICMDIDIWTGANKLVCFMAALYCLNCLLAGLKANYILFVQIFGPTPLIRPRHASFHPTFSSLSLHFTLARIHVKIERPFRAQPHLSSIKTALVLVCITNTLSALDTLGQLAKLPRSHAPSFWTARPPIMQNERTQSKAEHSHCWPLFNN